MKWWGKKNVPDREEGFPPQKQAKGEHHDFTPGHRKRGGVVFPENRGGP